LGHGCPRVYNRDFKPLAYETHISVFELIFSVLSKMYTDSDPNKKKKTKKKKKKKRRACLI
jgi:hypothetical protein